MHKVLNKISIAPLIYQLDISGPLIACKANAGQFVIMRIHEKGERIPLTIADFDREGGVITCVFQVVGKTTMDLSRLKQGDTIKDMAGPLGKPSGIGYYGKVICIGGGVGVAPVYPIVRSLSAAGNEVVGIIGARTKDLIFWEDKMNAVCNELYITTDDGSYMRQGFVTDVLKDIADNEFCLCVAIGPVNMMRSVCDLTKEYGIRTIVSLNPIMVDGTGMCGCCRVTVGGRTRFACVDGPEFDGHQVDFNELSRRLADYRDLERIAMNRYMLSGCDRSCNCGGKANGQ